MAHAQGCIRGDANGGGHVTGIVLGLLRVRQRDHRSLKEHGGHALDPRRRLHTGTEHLKTAAVVEEQPADADLDVGAALAAGGEQVRGHRRVGFQRRTTETQQENTQ